MSFFTIIWQNIVIFFNFMLWLLSIWWSLFITPLRFPELLWVVTPAYTTFFIKEFMVEKKKLTFIGAMSNSIIPLWASIIWAKHIITSIWGNLHLFNLEVFIKLVICIIIFGYGVMIIYLGIKRSLNIKYFARVREVTYIILTLTPIIYDYVRLDKFAIISIIIFFPIFYYLTEFIDYCIPDPSPDLQEDILRKT